MKPAGVLTSMLCSQIALRNSCRCCFPADNLSEAQMQPIARELGHSETAFLLHSDDSGAHPLLYANG